MHIGSGFSGVYLQHSWSHAIRVNPWRLGGYNNETHFSHLPKCFNPPRLNITMNNPYFDKDAFGFSHIPVYDCFDAFGSPYIWFMQLKRWLLANMSVLVHILTAKLCDLIVRDAKQHRPSLVIKSARRLTRSAVSICRCGFKSTPMSARPHACPRAHLSRLYPSVSTGSRFTVKSWSAAIAPHNQSPAPANNTKALIGPRQAFIPSVLAQTETGYWSVAVSETRPY